MYFFGEKAFQQLNISRSDVNTVGNCSSNKDKVSLKTHVEANQIIFFLFFSLCNQCCNEMNRLRSERETDLLVAISSTNDSEMCKSNSIQSLFLSFYNSQSHTLFLPLPLSLSNTYTHYKHISTFTEKEKRCLKIN